MNIKTWRNPYDTGVSYTKPKEIEIHPGLTVLVGCNGAGKTTLLQNIKEHCKDNNIPCMLYDNLQSGGFSSLAESLYSGNYADASCMWNSSEGENIKYNVIKKDYGFFMKECYENNSKSKLFKVFNENYGEDLKQSNIRVLLFDAVDSGLSIDIVMELKIMFQHMIKDNQNCEVYIIISANEYELANGTDCFDVVNGKYVSFANYESFKSFILKNRAYKEKRIQKEIAYIEKQKEKDLAKYNKLKEKYEAKKKEYGDNPTWKQQRTLDNLRYNVNDFVGDSNYLDYSYRIQD